MGFGGNNSVHHLVLVVPSVEEGIGTVGRGGGSVHQVYCLRRGDIAFIEKGVQLGPERWRAADKVEVHFKGGKGDQGRI